MTSESKIRCHWCGYSVSTQRWTRHIKSKYHEKQRFRQTFSFKYPGKKKCPECTKKTIASGKWANKRTFTSKGLSIHCGNFHKGKRIVLESQKDGHISPRKKGIDGWFQLHTISSRKRGRSA